MAGLASLTANYTDSEDEGQDEIEDSKSQKVQDFGGSSGPPSLVGKFRESQENTPNSVSSSARSTPVKKAAPLVSYIDPEDEDPGENVQDNGESAMDFERPEDEASQDGQLQSDKNSEPVPMDLDSENESTKREENEETEKTQEETPQEVVSGIHVEAWTEGVKLPPEPPGLCSARLQENINRLWKKKQESNFDMNAVIQNKKAFRNPSIYEKLIQFCGIDEHGTNFPKELYDGHLFGKESYYDELAKNQKTEMDRREKAAKDRAKSAAENVAATVAKKIEEPKRKSKWDQGPATGAVRPAGISIPAFGALTKK